MRILLVDDSRTIRNFQKGALKGLGYDDILEASDGLEALKIFGATPPDLMLVDWNMPNMDGISLIRKIRETDKTVPIIMCTSESDRSRVLEAVNAGVNNYIVKPFTAKTLAEKIHATLSKSGRPQAVST
jgi:two-component system chemotaxis response regulator CheY